MVIYLIKPLFIPLFVVREGTIIRGQPQEQWQPVNAFSGIIKFLWHVLFPLNLIFLLAAWLFDSDSSHPSLPKDHMI